MQTTTIEMPSFIGASTDLRLLGAGKQAFCFAVADSFVIKGEHQVFESFEDASVRAIELQQEYDFWMPENRLAHYVNPSTTIVDETKHGFRVWTQESLTQGVSIADSISASRADSDVNLEPIADFYTRVLRIFRETGIMADVTGRPSFVGWRRPNHTPNVIVENNKGAITPKLIDKGFIRGGKIERWWHPRTIQSHVGGRLAYLVLSATGNISEEVASKAGKEIRQLSSVQQMHINYMLAGYDFPIIKQIPDIELVQ